VHRFVLCLPSARALVHLVLLAASSPLPGYTIPADWVYDIVNEFVYFFQAFHEQRAVYERACREGAPSSDASLEKALHTAWAPHEVISVLRRAIDASGLNEQLKAAKSKGAAMSRAEMEGEWMVPEITQLAGAFSLVCLVRVEAKLGDHASAVEAARHLTANFSGPFARVPRGHLSLHSYLGFSLMMLGRFADAARTVSSILLLVHRTSALLAEGGTASRFMKKTAEKMLALLALCEALSPGSPIDELVRRKVRDRFSAKMDAIEAGGDEAESALAELFQATAPAFIDASWPPVAVLEGAGEEDETPGAQLAHTHRRVFLASASARVAHLSGLRPLLKLYTSIDLPKLSRLAGVSEERARASLFALKLQSWQQQQAASKAEEDVAADDVARACCDPVHFFVGGETGMMVEVDMREQRAGKDVTAVLARHTMALSRAKRPVTHSGRGGRE
jgi:translation initiation factor 3 subunit L